MGIRELNAAWYALRRTLPPWSADEGLAELVEFCKHSHIDEVISKVDTEEFSHGLPTLEWVDGYIPVLQRVRDTLTAAGVVFSINPWVTLVHYDCGRESKSVHPDVQNMVGHDGIQARVVACPLSEGWRRLTAELWRRYASLNPDVLWVEDDIRLLNHSPVGYGCFCPLHMSEFSRKVGKEVSREELVAALVAPGEPHPYRRIWLDLNRDIMVDVFGLLERTVHEVSPQTKLGLMCSLPTHHAIEGRDWPAFVSALAGDQPLVARPCMGNYHENSPRGLYDSEFFVRITRHCLGPGVLSQTEVENWPFSTYSKSAKFTFLQMALSFALGSEGVTMNLFDHMGTPLGTSPEYGEMLREKKAYLNSLAERCRGGKASGIQFIHAPDGSYNMRLPEGSHFMDLAPEAHEWRKVLGPFGYSITFEQSDVVALTGQAIRSFTGEEIRKILSGGVLLDLSALKCLIDMGYGDQLGVSIKREFCRFDELKISTEEYFNPDFGGAERKYISSSLPNLHRQAWMAEVEPMPGAVVVSRMVNADAEPVYPFLVVFENPLGGRVAVYPIDLPTASGPAFLGVHRKQQVDAVVQWLFQGRVPLQVNGGAYPLAICNDLEDRSSVVAFNLSLDEWPNMTFDMYAGGREVAGAEILNDSGVWHEDKSISWNAGEERLSIHLDKPVSPLSLTALTVRWA